MSCGLEPGLFPRLSHIFLSFASTCGLRSSSFTQRMARRRLLQLLLLSAALRCKAQTNKLFQWQFTNSQISTSLPSCGALPIVVKSFNTSVPILSTPPYYMMAIAVNGIPTVSLIGTDVNNLTWVVDQPIDSSLLLDVIDANGSAGGVAPRLYKVVPVQTTNCLPSSPAKSDFFVTANVTDALETCQPWGLTITGGVPPYTVTLAQPNSPVVTNTSTSQDDDLLTYINRGDTGSQLIAAVSDFTGRWANGSAIVKTQGPANVDCTGLVTSSGKSSDIKKQAEEAAAAAASAHRRTNIIIGVCVSVGALLVIGAIFAFFYRRRQRLRREEGLGPDLSPRQFRETEDHHLSITSFNDHNTSTSRASKSHQITESFSGLAMASDHYADTPAFDPYSDATTSDSANASSNISQPSPNGIASFPMTSVRQHKSREAGHHHPSTTIAYPPDSASDSSSQVRLLSDRRAPAATGSAHLPVAVGTSTADGGEFIIQHRDGGIVRELPPPYADRTVPGPAV